MSQTPHDRPRFSPPSGVATAAPSATSPAETGGEDSLEDAIEHYLELHRRKQAPTVEEFAKRYPSLTQEIREFFPTLVAMEQLKVKKQQAGGGRATLAGQKLSQLGDFRIIREIGRGGMGVVFEAEQLSLGRHVAIKVLPSQALHDPKQVARFQREAQTAARLHHTNIIPVFGVGYQDGFHYLVMQLIDGVGLDRVLDQRTRSRRDTKELHHPSEQTATLPQSMLEPNRSISGAQPSRPQPNRSVPLGGREVAALGCQVAAALAYAHKQGTLHRDIKPANLLLDSLGVLWIADFGLAKALHQNELSQTGDLVGTLRYMAPERFRGECDERSDIYGLGLTLYELLTDRPGFPHTDHNTLMRQVMQEQPLAPRKIDPAIPSDLETIVLKCIAKEPAARYQRADDVAADLRRFLEDRPIQARRAHVLERSWRWCRRNPAVAGLSAAAVLLLLLVASISSVAFLRTNQALESESAQRQRAEKTLAISLQALEKVYARLAPGKLGETESYSWQNADGEEVTIPIQPVISNENMVLLQELLVFYDRLAEQGGDNALLQEQAAKANARVGDIQRRLGHLDRARTALEQAIERYELLAADADRGDQFNTRVGQLKNEFGLTLLAENRREEARQLHRDALRTLLSPDHSDASLDCQYELARTYYLLGRSNRLDSSLGPGVPTEHGGPGSPPHPHGNGPPRGGPPPHPGKPPRPGGRDFGDRTAPRPSEIGGRDGSRADRLRLDQAIRILKELDSKDRANPRYKRLLAQCYRDIEQMEGESDNERSVAILRELVAQFPRSAELKHDLAEMLLRTSGRGRRGGGLTPLVVESRLAEARDILDTLAVENPQVPMFDAALVRVLFRLGEFYGRDAERVDGQQRDDWQRRAGISLNAAVQLQDTLVQRHPGVQAYQLWQLVVREVYGRYLVDAGDFKAARQLLEQSSDKIEQLEASLLELDGAQTALHHTFMTLHLIYIETGEVELAEGALSSAKQFRSGPDPLGHPRPPHPR